VEIHLLDVTIYGESGRTWRTEEIREPTWTDIEAAIRRLDRFHYPFVWLYRSAVVERGMTGDRSKGMSSLPDFEVIGGEGEFAMDARTDSSYHRYYDQSRGDGMIEIWRSDQGASFEKKYCCPSLDITLHATCYFCEHGTLDPALTWQPQPW
jgi:hypothetical protein